ncbi:MAG: class I SAM-dependent methyltransferase [Acidobacteriota bacterium]|nr:class I SAM-dependent methyltransferase [Acidobacteriota bacterium]
MIHRAWDELARIYAASTVETELAQTREFALGRLDEGRQVGAWLLERFPARRPLRVLDVGAGNGGVSLGVANYAATEVHALDVLVNPELRALQRETALPIHASVGVGERLPFRDGSFDVVLCLETIEHVRDPQFLAREILRVLNEGGECMITTPARFRYFFRRDPHYGIPGLLLLPDALQRFVATKIVRRTKSYDVEHIFWSVAEIVRLFEGATKHEAFWNRAYPSARSRQRDAIWFRYKHLMWDRIVVTK